METQSNTIRNRMLAFYTRHNYVLLWILIFLTMILLNVRVFGWLAALRNAITTIVPMLLCTTITRYLLLPRLLHRSRFIFFISCLVVFAVLVPVSARCDMYIHSHFADPMAADMVRNDPQRFGQTMLLLHLKYIFLLLLVIAATSISYLVDERKRQTALFREQQMQEQLKYLRAQINPHFLFNALNCIYALTMMKDEQAPASVLKLSEMLRYVIDDCRADSVPLTKEVRYIQNYIDFQRIRMEREPDLTFDVQIADPAYTIPPMLLQPIIENCFKHSRLVDDPHAWVRISIRQNDSGLLFTCDNSKPSANSFSRQSAIIGRQDEERTGIGLMNVQQRLAVLFGDKCSLKVIEDPSHYKTVLHI